MFRNAKNQRSGNYSAFANWASALLVIVSLNATAGGQEISPATTAIPPVLTGIDVLKQNGFKDLVGKRIGLITNHTGLDFQGCETAVLLHEAKNVDLVTLFSPEHGYQGKLDQSTIGNDKDKATGLQIVSLYGKTRRPTAEMLADIDVLVFDIQDIGARFYTYISTMGEAMIAANEHGKRFVVLDRPNPIDGVSIAGPMLDHGTESFVGFHHLPIRHGMTIGELAMMFHSELNLSAPLDVIRCQGWHREMTFDECGSVWVNPSPNMRSLTQAFLYPGVGMLETSNLSVGRGTDTPFEVIGAPWIEPIRFAQSLDKVPGMVFVPIRFTPDASRYKDEACGGVNLVITDRTAFDPIRLGITLAVTLQRLYPDHWQAERANKLLGSQSTLDAILAGQSVSEVMLQTKIGLDDFAQRRSEFLLY
ncbi:exo-beta-N-acetylmuramidase NamZ domain-containing protein [Rhodopirellula sp. MGV]|uniref:exo-beta-N-acetylmuramidase NamZ family protein n=1 Tax=Rhodopirellula sp. MGV TaxID=2023130 RepID=UPI000B963857|nr:DUF1343 domain-containing protein [Rhodopirellula sp. MGV]OYP36737.1 hypothetical protein CGZ80_07500 [Rhodopirellula sp. MGV]PNY34430.1 DUF1343 domain-containing protein [Rhodopirellula baltica]